MDRFEEDLYSVGPLQIFKLLIMLFVISHWLSCSWYYFGDDEEGLALDREGNVIQGWAKKRFTGLSEADDYTKYVSLNRGCSNVIVCSVWFSMEYCIPCFYRLADCSVLLVNDDAQHGAQQWRCSYILDKQWVIDQLH
eukprot:SAG31_NODE_1712_length_7468_cov_8.329896_6_plen_138_part_00